MEEGWEHKEWELHPEVKWVSQIEDEQGTQVVTAHIKIGHLGPMDEDIKLHNRVLHEGYPNRWGARIEVKSQWNLNKMEKLLDRYTDREVVEWLRYGWPIGRLPTLPEPLWATKNHKGGTEHPEALRKYKDKEAQKGAIMGPYQQVPFNSKVGISPLSTHPKKNSQERRVILDLSFPEGRAVNDGISKDYYMGFKIQLNFPKIDDSLLRIFHLGKGAMMFKVDLSRYFRQISMDPGDYSLIGYIIEGEIYFDKVLPMGLRSAPYIAQRLSNALAWIHQQLQFYLLNYVDDFVGAEVKETI